MYHKVFYDEIPKLISNGKFTLIQSSLNIRKFKTLKNRRHHAMDAYIHMCLLYLHVLEVKYYRIQIDVLNCHV